MQNAFETLGFEQIREQLAAYAATQQAKAQILALAPLTSEVRLRGALRETDGARQILDFAGMPPLPDTEAAKNALTLAEKGGRSRRSSCSPAPPSAPPASGSRPISRNRRLPGHLSPSTAKSSTPWRT